MRAAAPTFPAALTAASILLLPGSCRRPAHISTSSGHRRAPISPGSHTTTHLVLVGLHNRTTPGRSTPPPQSVHCSNTQDPAATMSFPRQRSMEHLVSLLLQGGRRPSYCTVDGTAGDK